MTRFFLSIFLLMFLTIPVLRGQVVEQKFTREFQSDNFENDDGTWKILSNADNLLLIQNGLYQLHRKNNLSSYSVFPNWNILPGSFEISVALTLNAAGSPESGAGVIFMAQEDGSGAFVFEINEKKQYRLKQLVGLNYVLRSGAPKTNGWVENSAIRGMNEVNLIQIKTAERNYDVYINQQFVISFNELAYKSGKSGLFIGPSTRLSVDKFSVYLPESQDETDPLTKIPEIPVDSHNLILEEVKRLRSENLILRDSLKIFREENRILNKKLKTQPGKNGQIKHQE
jgi:hypothetical protein